MLEKEKIEKIFANSRVSQSLSEIQDQIDDAIRNGNRKLAYELSLQSTQVAPNDAYAWFLRASLAPTLEERIISVNRLNELDPAHQDKHNLAFFTLKELLEADPFLAYLEESEELYRVLRPDRRVLSIPKKRAIPAPPPHEQKDELKAAHRWLGIALLGLLFAGLLTVVFAPLAAWSAIQTGQFSREHVMQIRSSIVVFTSILLFVVGLFFMFLLVLHLIG
jgi:hypothetical protein